MIEKLRCPFCLSRVKIQRLAALERVAVACLNEIPCGIRGPARRRRADAIKSWLRIGNVAAARAAERKSAARLKRRCQRLQKQLAKARKALRKLRLAPRSQPAESGPESPAESTAEADSRSAAEPPSGCPTGKRGFSSRRSARRSINASRASWRAGVYPCDRCPEWHLANYDKRGSGEGQRRRRSSPYQRPPPGSDRALDGPDRREDGIGLR